VVKRRKDHQSRRPDVSVEFGHDVVAPRQARHAIRPLLSDDEDPIAERVEAVTSELVSNVVQHTDDGGSVEAWDPKPDVPFRLEVSDTDATSPTPREADDRGGRGLSIVDQLSDRWGTAAKTSGKTVWAEFDRTPADDD
jgi:anti-sigma regulatory factor (Ser/Thr protein kinase)